MANRWPGECGRYKKFNCNHDHYLNCLSLRLFQISHPTNTQHWRMKVWHMFLTTARIHPSRQRMSWKRTSRFPLCVISIEVIPRNSHHIFAQGSIRIGCFEDEVRFASRLLVHGFFHLFCIFVQTAILCAWSYL